MITIRAQKSNRINSVLIKSFALAWCHVNKPIGFIIILYKWLAIQCKKPRKKIVGVSVFDFKVPDQDSRGQFIGYGCVPGLGCEVDKQVKK